MKYLTILLALNLYAAEGIKVSVTPSKTYIDLGIVGKTYDITEPDLYENMMKEIAAYKPDKEEMTKTLTDGINNMAIYKPSVEFCETTEIGDWKTNYFKLPEAIVNPLGRVVYEKGKQFISPSVPNETNICFVDGTFMLEAKNQINFMKKRYNKCIYLVSNMDVRELQKVYPNIDIFPGNDAIFSRFNIKCTTGVVSLKDTLIKKEYFSIGKFKN